MDLPCQLTERFVSAGGDKLLLLEREEAGEAVDLVRQVLVVQVVVVAKDVHSPARSLTCNTEIKEGWLVGTGVYRVCAYWCM